MKYRIGDLYEVSNGLSKAGEFFGTGSPFLSFSTVFNNYFIPPEINDFVQSTEKEQTSYSVKAGDVFITRTSETTEELGMSCVALKDYPSATYNGFCKRLRPITDHTNPLYMGYYLRSSMFRANFKKVASLITRASLRNEDLMKFPVDLPPYEEQTKISDILFKYDALIENNNKRIKVLEQMAESLYKEWFVRFRFPGYENAEFENDFPKSWQVRRIKTCVKRLPFNRLYKAHELDKNGSVIVIDQSSAEYLGFHNNKPSHYADYDKPIILFGDHSCKFVLMCMDFSLGENVIPFISNNDEEINTFYLYYSVHKLISTEEYKRHWSRLINMKILVPPIELQNCYAEKVSTIKMEINNLKKANRNLAKQRDMLLPRLMSGKLEV